MDMSVVIAVGFAMLFQRMAAYERMTSWMWVIASLGLSSIVMLASAGFAPMILTQLGLFGMLWWQNAKQHDQRAQRWANKREEEVRLQEERMRRAQEEIKRERERRDE